MFKKVYVELTNNCNLNCSFCKKNDRVKEYLSLDNFKIIMSKLDGYTKYLYFHLMGEPLIHKDINELIDIGSTKYNINITTNGYNIKRIKDNKNIHQINISLHSYDKKYNKTLDEYLNDIFLSVDKLSENTIISYRMWVDSVYKTDIINMLNNKYNVIIDGNTKLRDNIYFEYDTEFIWPDINNNYYTECGSCMGLRTHIGILVDGSIVPCCLDYNGYLKLGNIYKDDLSIILNSDKVKNMIDGFKNNKKIEELCKHCNFYDRKKS